MPLTESESVRLFDNTFKSLLLSLGSSDLSLTQSDLGLCRLCLTMLVIKYKLI